MLRFKVCWGHPRSRGEHAQPARFAIQSVGSSPLARGAQFRLLRPVHALGIIPARAGSTNPGKFQSPGTGDHPRSRGEHLPELGSIQVPEGSSPLARGALYVSGGKSPSCGIIPARAGSTRWSDRAPSAPTDHPRSRGEHERPYSKCGGSRGSSPLARGAPVSGPLPVSARGIIPARAGSTSWRGSSPCSRWDHPRSRGEHVGADHGTGGVPGSSPLARGALSEKSGRAIFHGIIPARAGSTCPRLSKGSR